MPHFTPPTPDELLKKYRADYEREIKIAIDAQDYLGAAVLLGKLNFEVGLQPLEVAASFHCGLEFVLAARCLERMLFGGDPKRIALFQEAFEAYLAQTRLPEKPD